MDNETSTDPEGPSETPEPLPWEEPKLTFVEPTLTPQGKVNDLTGQGFFGTFNP